MAHQTVRGLRKMVVKAPVVKSNTGVSTPLRACLHVLFLALTQEMVHVLYRSSHFYLQESQLPIIFAQPMSDGIN